jgi:hypothetical protein
MGNAVVINMPTKTEVNEVTLDNGNSIVKHTCTAIGIGLAPLFLAYFTNSAGKTTQHTLAFVGVVLIIFFIFAFMIIGSSYSKAKINSREIAWANASTNLLWKKMSMSEIKSFSFNLKQFGAGRFSAPPKPVWYLRCYDSKNTLICHIPIDDTKVEPIRKIFIDSQVSENTGEDPDVAKDNKISSFYQFLFLAAVIMVLLVRCWSEIQKIPLYLELMKAGY